MAMFAKRLLKENITSRVKRKVYRSRDAVYYRKHVKMIDCGKVNIDGGRVRIITQYTCRRVPVVESEQKMEKGEKPNYP